MLVLRMVLHHLFADLFLITVFSNFVLKIKRTTDKKGYCKKDQETSYNTEKQIFVCNQK